MLQKNICTFFFAGVLAFHRITGICFWKFMFEVCTKNTLFCVQVLFHLVKGRVAVPKRMNFRISSKKGGGSFQSENLYCRFWTFIQGLSEKIALQVVLGRLVLGVGVRISCFSFNLVWVNEHQKQNPVGWCSWGGWILLQTGGGSWCLN